MDIFLLPKNSTEMYRKLAIFQTTHEKNLDFMITLPETNSKRT